MFFGNLENQVWCPERRWDAASHQLDRDSNAILTVAGSLTRFLERQYGMKLQVQLKDQFIDQMDNEEARLLQTESKAPVLRRQVSLTHRKATMFDAESILPTGPIPLELMKALHDGERPLANLLMDYGLSLSRLDLGIAQISGDSIWAGYWARRSVLRAESGIQALVVEVFHPAMWKRLQMLKSHRNSRVD